MKFFRILSKFGVPFQPQDDYERVPNIPNLRSCAWFWELTPDFSILFFQSTKKLPTKGRQLFVL